MDAIKRRDSLFTLSVFIGFLVAAMVLGDLPIQILAVIGLLPAAVITRKIRYGDYVLALLVANVVLFYNLAVWRTVTIEELRFYQHFFEPWLSSGFRFNSFRIPTYLLIYPVPTRDLIALRYVIAFLGSLGAVFYYGAVKHIAGTKAGALAFLLLLTDTWFLWNARHFMFFWSAITLSALTLWLLVRYRERSVLPTAVISSVSIINFAQAVFFVFPYLASATYMLREKIDRSTLFTAAIILSILLTPSVLLFKETQEDYVEFREKYEDQVDYTLTIPEIDIPIIEFPLQAPHEPGSDAIKIVFDPFRTFESFRNRLAPSRHTPWDAVGAVSWTDPFTYLAGLLLLAPVFFSRFSTWQWTPFFASGGVLSVIFLITFPAASSQEYTWPFFLFFYPLICYALFRERKRHVKIVAALLIVILLSLNTVDSYQQIVADNEIQEVNEQMLPLVGNQTAAVTPTSKAILAKSSSNLLDELNSTTMSCNEAIHYDGPTILTFDCYRGINPYNGTVLEYSTRWLRLYS